MAEKECIRRTSDPIIPLKDAGLRATFENKSRKKYTIYDVDGCLIKNSTAADFAIESAANKMVIVEFKGRHVEHAIHQVSETIKYFVESRGFQGRFASVIVSRQVPIGAATLNRHKLAFRKKHAGAPLIISSSKRCFCLDELAA